MMKKLRMELGLVLLLAASAFSQTELFDQDFSGIHPYAGLKWNSKIMQPMVGFDYVIEGRTALGIQAGMPTKDTLFSTPAGDSLVAGTFKSYYINPYAVFELVAPDNLNKFSFLLRADYIHEGVESDTNGNGYSRNAFGVGPIFAYTFQTGEKVDWVPSASYEFFYTKWKRDWPTHVKTGASAPLYDNEYFIQHYISVGIDVAYHLTETQGLNLEPKLVLKMGEGLLSSDLLNVDVQLGYFLSF